MEEAKNITIDGETLEQLIINLTAKIGEKISFRRMICVPKEENQVFGVYSHMNGKIGVTYPFRSPNIAKSYLRGTVLHTMV